MEEGLVQWRNGILGYRVATPIDGTTWSICRLQAVQNVNTGQPRGTHAHTNIHRHHVLCLQQKEPHTS